MFFGFGTAGAGFTDGDGIPLAFGAWEFLDVKARIIMDAINGIML